MWWLRLGALEKDLGLISDSAHISFFIFSHISHVILDRLLRLCKPVSLCLK